MDSPEGTEAPAPEAPVPTTPRTGLDPWVRFTGLFAILAIATEILYYAWILGSPALDIYLSLLASVSGLILNVVGQDVEVVGTSIWNGAFMVDIAPECDAIQLCTLLMSAIIAFPAQLGKKLIGLLIGLSWLQIVNFTRIASLYFVGAHFAESTFRNAHEVVWPVVLIIVTMLTWIAWARRLGDPLDVGRPANSPSGNARSE